MPEIEIKVINPVDYWVVDPDAETPCLWPVREVSLEELKEMYLNGEFISIQKRKYVDILLSKT